MLSSSYVKVASCMFQITYFGRFPCSPQTSRTLRPRGVDIAHRAHPGRRKGARWRWFMGNNVPECILTQLATVSDLGTFLGPYRPPQSESGARARDGTPRLRNVYGVFGLLVVGAL